MAESRSGLGALNVLRQAASGNTEAMKAVARMALPNYRQKFRQYDSELDHHRTETWDVDELREWALDPETEVDPETFMAAWNEIMNNVLIITAATAPMLAGDQRESEVFERRIRQASLDLFLLVNNPVIRYSIIAGFEPRFRENVDEMLARIGRETWGTLEALVQDELQLENYPPETAEVLRQMAEQVEADAAAD